MSKLKRIEEIASSQRGVAPQSFIPGTLYWMLHDKGENTPAICRAFKKQKLCFWLPEFLEEIVNVKDR